MGRIVGIDYGSKRVGLAATDPLQIIASPLETVHSKEVISYLKTYQERESIDTFVIGMPKNLNNESTDATGLVLTFIKQMEKNFPGKEIVTQDERFTSKMALDAMIAGGTSKKQRREKGNIDKISATIILQSYLDSKR